MERKRKRAVSYLVFFKKVLMRRLREKREICALQTTDSVPTSNNSCQCFSERYETEKRIEISFSSSYFFLYLFQVPFDDSRFEELNQMNVGAFDRRAEEGKWEVKSTCRRERETEREERRDKEER